MKKLNKEHYICKCNICDNIYLIKESEISEVGAFSVVLRYYECEKCLTKIFRIYKLDNLIEFSLSPLVEHKTEFDPRENDHQ